LYLAAVVFDKIQAVIVFDSDSDDSLDSVNVGHYAVCLKATEGVSIGYDESTTNPLIFRVVVKLQDIAR
jgi:hypothetical protein